MNGADLDGVTSGLIVGRPVLPLGWLIVKGYLVGNGAVLTDANLSGGNLYDANLVNENLTGAILDGVQSGKVQGQFTVKLPNNWAMINGYLVGPSADLNGANFAGIDFGYSGLDLAGANFTDANLSGIHLVLTNLIDANMSGANLTSASILESPMTEVNLVGSQLTDANFTGSNMSTVITDAETTCPSGVRGPCANL